MEIIFTKITDLKYVSRVVREDGIEFVVYSYDKTSWLPHDLGHFVVETNLGLKHGFWGCVAAGAILPSMELTRGKLKPSAMTRSKEVLRKAGQHANEAEIWVGFFLYSAERNLDQNHNLFQSKINNMWLSHKSERKTVSVGEGRRICTQLRELKFEWQNLVDGQTLSFRWH